MRHNLLIVDDEELIRKGFLARLAHLNIALDECFEASGGMQALEIVKREAVDIVVTDIRMPDMDGLTLIREIQKLREGIQFVVLSGYAEFAYAEQAIRLGVRAYLLKPLSNEELKNTFRDLYREMEDKVRIRSTEWLQRRLEREKQETDLEKEINELFSHSGRESFDIEQLSGLLIPVHSQARAEENPEMKQTPGLPEAGDLPEGTASCLYFAILNIDPESFAKRNFSQADYELLRFTVKNVFREAETGGCARLIVNSRSEYNQLYAVFVGEDEKQLKSQIEKLYLRMRSVLEKKMNIFLSLGVSRSHTHLDTRAVQESQWALKQQLVYGNASLYFFDDVKISGDQEFPGIRMHLLQQYMEEGQTARIRAMLREIFSEDMAQQYGTAYLRVMWMRVMNMAFLICHTGGENQEAVERLVMSFNFPEQTLSVEELRRKITDAVLGCFGPETVHPENAKGRLRKAVRYIGEHYSENLSVNDLAERFGMSPNYFSSLFKRETGKTAVNYMTQLRVERAQDFLANSDMSVAEISGKVGYEDSQYFFRIFKKYTGRTPLEWRQEQRFGSGGLHSRLRRECNSSPLF